MPKIAVDSILDKEAVLDADSVGESNLHKKLEINEIARKSVGLLYFSSDPVAGWINGLN